MNSAPSTVRLIGSSLLAVIAAAPLVLAVFTTLLIGSARNSAPLSYLAIGLGMATAIALLLPDSSAA